MSEFTVWYDKDILVIEDVIRQEMIRIDAEMMGEKDEGR